MTAAREIDHDSRRRRKFEKPRLPRVAGNPERERERSEQREKRKASYVPSLHCVVTQMLLPFHQLSRQLSVQATARGYTRTVQLYMFCSHAYKLVPLSLPLRFPLPPNFPLLNHIREKSRCRMMANTHYEFVGEIPRDVLCGICLVSLHTQTLSFLCSVA